MITQKRETEISSLNLRNIYISLRFTTMGIENFDERYNALRRPTKLRILAPTDEGGVGPTTLLARSAVRKNNKNRKP
jgi:hypothetical protein